MDPEIVERLNEQLREMFEILSEQNSMMASQMKAMKDQVAASDKVTKSNKEQSKSNDELTDSTEELTKKQEAYARAEKERQDAVQEATDRINGALNFTAGAFLSFGSAVMDSTQSFQKYNSSIGMLGNAAADLGKNFGVLGNVIGGVIKASTMLIQYQLEQKDNLLKFSDDISKLGAVNSFSTSKIQEMAISVGLTSRELDKIMKPIQSLGSAFKSIGQGAADSTKKFFEMTAVTEDVRNEFRRLGYNDEQRIAAQATYIEQMAATGVSLRGMEKSSTSLQKSSLDYVKNLTILSEITGKTVEEQQKAQQMATANFEYQMYVQNTRRKIDETSDPNEKARLFKELEQAQVAVERIRALRGEEAALGFAQRLAGGPQTLGLAGQALAGTKGEEDKILKAVKQGTFEGQAVAEAQTALRDKNSRLYSTERGLGQALMLSPELRETTGGLAPLTETNRIMGMDAEKIAAEAKQAQEDLKNGKGPVGTDPNQALRDTFVETERDLRTLFDSFAIGMGMVIPALFALAGTATLAALSLGKGGGVLGKLGGLFGGARAAGAAGAGAAGAAGAGAAGAAGAGAAGAAGAGAAGAAGAGAAGAAGAGAAASKGAKLAGLAKGGARILGKLAAPLAIGMTAYDAFQGFNADKDAKLGDKFKNAGSSALNGLTFGLLGSSPEEIKARKEAEQAKPDSKKDESKTAADSKFADAFGKHVEKFGEIVNKLGSTNRGMSSSASFGKNIESFGKIVTAFAKTVTAFAKLTQVFATIAKTFSKAVTMFAAQNKSLNNLGTVGGKVKGKSTGLLGTSTEVDSELDVVDYIERLKTSLADAALSTDSLREAELKRHRFTEESMMQFRRSLTDASKILNKIAGVEEEDEDAATDNSSPGGAPSGPSDPGTPPGMGAPGGMGGKVVEAGKGYTTIENEDGRVEKRTGSRNWRNNNPGNLEYGEFAKSQGAIGSDGRFAVFANYEQGRAAKETLLFEGSKYKGLTIGEAIKRYAPPNENNTGRYIRTVTKAIGRNANTPLEDLTREQRTAMMNAMEKVEGFKQGKTEVLREGSPNAIGKDLNLPPARSSNGIVPLGRALQALGLRVDENIHFDGKHPRKGVHSRKGGHYDGTAIDVNAPGGIVEANDKKWRSKFDQIARAGAAAGYHTLWRSPDGNHDNHIHFQYSGSMGRNSNVGGKRRGETLQARKGGMFDGPDSGYPVEMHGSEMITPLTQDSILAKLAKTPAETPEISNAISSTAPTMEKEILERVVNMNAELVEGMLSKLGDMVSAISDGNDTREKILKNSMV